MFARSPLGVSIIESDINALTQREQQVLALIGRGYSIPQIAEKLFRSQKTIETHRQSLGRKLGASNRVELARIAIQTGLAPLDARSARARGQDDPHLMLSGDPDAADAVYQLESACAAVVGTAYCRALVERLPQVLDTAGAAVLSLEENGDGRTLAMRHRESWLDLSRFSLEGSPCACVVRDGFLVCEGDVAQRFSDWMLLGSFDVTSYMGLRLETPGESDPVGVLLVFHDQPEAFAPFAEKVLRVCAVRAAAELEQMRLIDSLQRSVETLEQRSAARQKA